MKQSYTQRGFTLLEVLIAITITALIGIGSSQILSSAIKTNEQTQEKLTEFRDLQKTFLLLSRDLQQVAPRAIRDEYGDYQSAVFADGSDYILSFTRYGWRNPLDDPRSDMQRVAYELRDGDLIRHYWEVLDQVQDSESIERTIIKGVEELSFTFLDTNKKWLSEWPPESDGSSDGNGEVEDKLFRYMQLPVGITVTFNHPKYGELKKVFDLPQALEAKLVDVTAGNNNGNDTNGENGEDAGGDDTGEDGEDS